VLLDRERPVAQVRQDDRRDLVVVREGVALAKPELRPPELIRIARYVSPR
jgi:hypothetical protein